MDLLRGVRKPLASVAAQIELSEMLQHIIHLLYGHNQLIHYKANKKKQWVAKVPTLRIGTPSSISETNNYVNACDAALRSDQDFSRFKSEKYYKEILEHTGLKFGKRYLRVLKKRNFDIPLQFVLRQSSVGSPEVYDFEDLGAISPSTLRYLKVVSDLNLLFPGWTSTRIVEVGVGYGGQLCALKEVGHVAEYLGLDLDVVARLARKYVYTSGYRDYYSFLGFDGDLPESQGHLFLSNYAFSELAPDHQKLYIDKYVLTSAAGYITWNRLSELSLGGMTAEEFRLLVRGRIVPEEPLTHPGNCIVVW